MSDADAKIRAGISKLAARRRALDISQADLSVRCGVSRQFLSMVESGRTQPNVQIALRLAAELQCSVEDLFGGADSAEAAGLAVQLNQPALPAGARLHVANVAGRWIAHAADSAESLADGFSDADALLAWTDGRAEAKAYRPLSELENNVAVAGCDPALALLRHGAGSARGAATLPRPGRCFWINCGSGRAMQLLAEGWVHAAGLHYSGSDPDENLRHVRRLDPDGLWQVLHFTRWENGWMIRREARARFKGADDLASGQVRLANRENGSGNRHWLDAEISRVKVPASHIAGYEIEFRSHWECARALRDGVADVAVGPRAIASAFGLDYIEAGQTSFDLVIPKVFLAHPNLLAILDRIRSRAFQHEIEMLAGYSAIQAGETAG